MVEYLLAKQVVAGSSPVSRSFHTSKENNMCGCGRSPREDGKCVGFHKIEESVWNEQKEVLVETYLRENSETKSKE